MNRRQPPMGAEGGNALEEGCSGEGGQTASVSKIEIQ